METAAAVSPAYPASTPQSLAIKAKDAGEFEVDDDGYVSISRLREWFNSYQDKKVEEIKEQRLGRRYYHGAQWTDEERTTLNDRKQPPITINLMVGAINRIVGVIAKLRQDPKASPRNETHAPGAPIGTAALREVCDANEWADLSMEVAHDIAVEGIGGCEIDLDKRKDGTVDISLTKVEPPTFFYDPRSIKPDFRDGRFMGIHKWLDLDAAIDLFPDKEDELTDSVDRSGEFADGLRDWEKLWYDNRLKQVKIVECWYRMRGKWLYCVHTRDLKLAEGVSPLMDENGETQCRYVMQSSSIDHDGDRYTFFRNLQGPQDETNHRRSKLLHLLNTLQVLAEDGAVQDVETARRELAKPDGWVVLNKGREFQIRDQSQQIQGQAELLAEAKSAIVNFGPSQQLATASTGVNAASSGRALQILMTQAFAELGPYLPRYKAWKLRVYRGIWNAVKQYWTTPRLIRVSGTADAKFIPVNQLVMTPQGPSLANVLGDLDMDIILDEGPDVITMNEDVLQLIDTMIEKGFKVPPATWVKFTNLPPAEKQELIESMTPPEPTPQEKQEQDLAKGLMVANAKAKIEQTQSSALKNRAEAAKAGSQAQDASSLARTHDLNAVKTTAEIQHQHAKTQQMRTDTAHTALQAHIAANEHLQRMAAPQGQEGGQQPAQQPARPVPGGPPVQAPDGHFYIHAPHLGGNYHRVVMQ